MQVYRCYPNRKMQLATFLLVLSALCLLLYLFANKKEKTQQKSHNNLHVALIRQNTNYTSQNKQSCINSKKLFNGYNAQTCKNKDLVIHTENLESHTAYNLITKYSLKETYSGSSIYYRVGNSNDSSRIIWLDLNKLTITQITN